jgi:hypothetical protein
VLVLPIFTGRLRGDRLGRFLPCIYAEAELACQTVKAG